ncbi:hypothetical protein NS277_12530 [Novosphingobium barchaimii]|nr:hypothetical protein NS277_12530 [Novosphingobium barchaimii]
MMGWRLLAKRAAISDSRVRSWRKNHAAIDVRRSQKARFDFLFATARPRVYAATHGICRCGQGLRPLVARLGSTGLQRRRDGSARPG